MTITSLIIFFAILFFLVVIHEAGHFLMAKWCKMRVDEFAFGFPPSLFSKKIGETLYSFNLIPLGGYVKIFGENGLSKEDLEKLPEHEQKQLFGNKKISSRLLVLVGGVLFNIIGAYLLFTISLFSGTKMFVTPEEITADDLMNKKLLLVDVKEKSPLVDTGLQRGMEILGASVEKDKVIWSLNKQEINSKTLSEFIQKYNDSQITLNYLNNENIEGEVMVIPKAGIVEGKKVIGASFANQVARNYSLPGAMVDAAKITFGQLTFIFVSLFELVKNLIFTDTKVEDNLAGPIGLAMMTSKVSERGFAEILSFAAMLSLSLAAFNILPIPALDGGRIVFVLLEAVRRKKVKAETEKLFHGLGFALLLLLMLFVSYFDIVKAFTS